MTSTYLPRWWWQYPTKLTLCHGVTERDGSHLVSWYSTHLHTQGTALCQSNHIPQHKEHSGTRCFVSPCARILFQLLDSYYAEFVWIIQYSNQRGRSIWVARWSGSHQVELVGEVQDCPHVMWLQGHSCLQVIQLVPRSYNYWDTAVPGSCDYRDTIATKSYNHRE